MKIFIASSTLVLKCYSVIMEQYDRPHLPMVLLRLLPNKPQMFHTCRRSGVQYYQRHTSHHVELQTCESPVSLQPRRTLQWGQLEASRLRPRCDPVLPMLGLHDFQYPYSIQEKYNLKPVTARKKLHGKYRFFDEFVLLLFFL